MFTLQIVDFGSAPCSAKLLHGGCSPGEIEVKNISRGKIEELRDVRYGM